MAPTVAQRILIAEDDRGVRQSLERTLRLEGFEVHEARNGAEALTACTACEPDLVILDVMMPEVDGLTACRTLRSRDAGLPILMLTARHEGWRPGRRPGGRRRRLPREALRQRRADRPGPGPPAPREPVGV